MWWHRLIRGEDTPAIQEVPQDMADAIRVRSYMNTALQQTDDAEERVSSVVGSLGGFHRANHFSQMAMESMSRLKE